MENWNTLEKKRKERSISLRGQRDNGCRYLYENQIKDLNTASHLCPKRKNLQNPSTTFPNAGNTRENDGRRSMTQCTVSMDDH
jgi:hypothetical protein